MDKDTKQVISDEELESSFNAAVEDLRKSLGDDEDLRKAKAEKAEDEDMDEEDMDEEESEEEEDEDEEMEKGKGKKKMAYSKTEKSLFDELSDDEDEDVAGAIDVAPFLGRLVKSIDKRFAQLAKQVGEATNLVKSQGKVLLAQAELQKSLKETTEKIAGTPVPTKGLRRLEKSRFEQDDKEVEVTGQEVLIKSSDWLQSRKIDLVEAGNIERRANKGTLFTRNDALDQKIKALLKEDK